MSLLSLENQLRSRSASCACQLPEPHLFQATWARRVVVTLVPGQCENQRRT